MEGRKIKKQTIMKTLKLNQKSISNHDRKNDAKCTEIVEHGVQQDARILQKSVDNDVQKSMQKQSGMPGAARRVGG
jgi:hypothetical protein